MSSAARIGAFRAAPTPVTHEGNGYAADGSNDRVEDPTEGTHSPARGSKRRTGPVLAFRRKTGCGSLTGFEDPTADGF